MIKKTTLVTLPMIFFFTSCSNEQKKVPEKSESEIMWDKREQLDTVNLKTADSLSRNYNSITGSDATIKFTY